MLVTVTSQSEHSFQQTISQGVAQVTSDISPEQDGSGQASEPFELLLGAWGACTNMTLQVYARRKNWPLQRVVTTLHKVESKTDTGVLVTIEKKIQVWGELSGEQVDKLKWIAEKCPVNQFIMGERKQRQVIGTIEHFPVE